MRWRTKRPEPALWARLKPKAQEMRHEATAAEARLCAVLKNGRIDGFKFRRQHAFENYIVDFFCAEANLVIEVDGSVHDANAEQDAYRQNILETSGFRVIRFKNQQVQQDISSVKQAIREALTNGPA
jgi:very-short-patch-repair endonuclease